MKLEVLRYSTSERSTLGLLFDITYEREFICYTLEDPYHATKVYGDTRIPSGCYDMELVENGRNHNKYLKRHGPTMHKGMLGIMDVPNFTGIQIHTGNTPSHTKGCLLVGDAPSSNVTGESEEDFLGLSGQAYKRFYSPTATALENGETVTIIFRNFESEVNDV